MQHSLQDSLQDSLQHARASCCQAKKENTANNYRYDRQARTVRSDAASRSAHPFRHTHTSFKCRSYLLAKNNYPRDAK
jgi:integrase